MRILIADDDATTRMILLAAVSRLGHDCVAAADGFEAWQRFSSTEGGQEVIISDWLMPGLDGLEFCQRVRSAVSDAYTYFIMLSALGERKHYLTGMQAGADDYLIKPLVFEDLQVRLISAERVTSLHRRLAEQRKELERLNQQLFTESRRDPLTHLGNRLCLKDDLDKLFARVTRYGHRYSLALFDIDYFKRYNDTYGHVAGDEALRSVARFLLEQLRSGDAAYRYGGEEFLIVYPEQTLDKAAIAAERIRSGIEGLRIPHIGNPRLLITLSGGVTEVNPGEPISVDHALRQADSALYSAKNAGRNIVILYGREPSPSVAIHAPLP